MPTEDSLAQLVVVGASAGGIEALPILLGGLPAGFGAPVVIAQHLDPGRPSRLEQILGRQSALPVHTVQDEARMDPGVVYVVPADRDVEIEDGHVRVQVRAADEAPADDGHPAHRTSKPSIDRLLRTAARGYGEGLIAVILTGMGADGAAGARDVKAAGGTVVIQNPATAQFAAMPQSLAPTTVDLVADIEAIGPLLQELLTGPQRVAMPEEDRRLRGLLAQVREQTGINFSAYKTPTILRRLQRRMVATDTHRLAEYLHYVQRHPEEYHRLASNFLIKVTGFFRDPELHEYLRREVLPELVTDARARGKELRVWSAGCATGEEAYTLAMLVADALGDELENFSVRVFATDLADDAIRFARRGVYPAQALEDVPPEFIERYFTESDGEYTVRKTVRALTVFGQHDLGQRAPFPRIDLALCRNVLIYFTPELQKRALQLFAFALRRGGYLALGKAETITPAAEHFAVSDARLRVYRRQGGDLLPMPATRIRDAAPPYRNGDRNGASRAAPEGGTSALGGATEAPLLPARPATRFDGAARAPRPLVPVRPGAERVTSLLQHLPLGVVLVDRRYDIQVINGAARRMLAIHSAAIGEDFIHQVRHVASSQLRAALDAALRDDPAGGGHQLTVDAPVPAGGTLQVDCFPFRGGASTEPMALVLVADVTESVTQRRELERRVGEAREALDQSDRLHQEELSRLAEQMQQLVDGNRELLEANQELIEANTELHNQYEELIVGHEEAEAATEEVETLNEELQATNEEQETLNEELQATVEELNTTNDDLEARSAELQELAASLEAERARLQAVLSTMGDGVVMLDGRGVPVLANEAYRRMFGERPNGGILPLPATDAEGRVAARDATIESLVARGEPFSVQFALAGPDGTLRRYEATGQPVHRGDHADGGTVITIRELAT